MPPFVYNTKGHQIPLCKMKEDIDLLQKSEKFVQLKVAVS